MNNRALTISILMAVIAVFFVQSYVSSIEDSARKKFGTEVTVIVAKKDIKEMENITESHIELKSVPKTFLEPGAISFESRGSEDGDDRVKKGLKELSGLIAIVPIRKGEQVTENKVTLPGVRTGLSPQIAPGRRAVAVNVSETSSVGKLVKPGDRVDVITVLDLGGKDKKIAKTLFQDVVVLAVGKYVANNAARAIETDTYTGGPKVRNLSEDTTFSTVTLEVEPAQAQVLALAMANGDNAINLSLRNNDDTDRVNIPSSTFQDLLGPDAARIPAGRR